jgi:ABC-type glutathione transport system ATPase component
MRTSQTHNVAMASTVADYVVLLGADGRISKQGAVSEVIAQEAQLKQEIEHEKAAIETDELEEAQSEAVAAPAPAAQKSGKLTREYLITTAQVITYAAPRSRRRDC